MDKERLEKLKNITVSMSEARRITFQTEDKSDEEFRKLVKRLEEKNRK